LRFSDKYINKEFKGKELDINKITVQILSGEEWFPAERSSNGLKLIYGTLWVSLELLF
jgi:phosphate transport system permease protein